MSTLHYPFAFAEGSSNQFKGTVDLEEPIEFDGGSGPGFYRPGKLILEGSGEVDLVLYHTEATSRFIYIRTAPDDYNLLEIAGLTRDEIASITTLPLPAQLCMGAVRTRLIGKAIRDIIGAPALRTSLASQNQHSIAVFPIAREGLKYQVAEAIFENYGFYCDEVVLDAHHVFDNSVPVYNRKVEMTLFKDKDLEPEQRSHIDVAFLADSIASGLVMKEVIARVKDRFDHIRYVEVISPFTTVRGLCRIAQSVNGNKSRVRLHIFETLLNALPPDYYYSSHFNIPEFHIRPDLEEQYRTWWGQDRQGNYIADTACAGYGWSEVFFSPRKQINMMNEQLESRHNMSIADIIRRNM